MPYSVVRSISIFLLATLLGGCLMVGPDFRTPRGPCPKNYTSDTQPTKTVSSPASGKAGAAQHFQTCRDIPGNWWKLFHSPEINKLIVIGIEHSPNLAAAKATLREAQEVFYAQFASTMIPNISGSLFAERQQYSFSALGLSKSLSGIAAPTTLFNLYNVSVSSTYALDIFGGQRRALEDLCAQVNYQQFELEGAYLTLTANIVTTAISVASFKAQIAATNALIHAQAEQLKIVEQQFKLGGASKADVLTQETQLAQTKATLPPLQQNLFKNLHALSALIGSLPDEKLIPTIDLDKLTLPSDLPISIPSRLVRPRPDIQASEALLHAASAKIGIATANLYPQITIGGNYGFESLLIPTLFTQPSKVWLIGGNLAQPIFNAGALRAKRRAAIDAYYQACAQYKQTILQAFQNVADFIRVLEFDAKELQAQKNAEIAAKKSLKLTQQQYKLGASNYLLLLNAQRQYQQAVINRIQAQAARYNDTAGLFQAMGGGWWNRPCSLT